MRRLPLVLSLPLMIGLMSCGSSPDAKQASSPPGEAIPLLAPSRMVIAFDEQGPGRTKAVDRPFTFENSADDAAALLDYLKIHRADVMGFSQSHHVKCHVDGVAWSIGAQNRTRSLA